MRHENEVKAEITYLQNIVNNQHLGPHMAYIQGQYDSLTWIDEKGMDIYLSYLKGVIDALVWAGGD